jgi:hypothetical protein
MISQFGGDAAVVAAPHVRKSVEGLTPMIELKAWPAPCYWRNLRLLIQFFYFWQVQSMWAGMWCRKNMRLRKYADQPQPPWPFARLATFLESCADAG